MKKFRPGLLVSLVALVLSSHAQTTAGFSLAYTGVKPFTNDHKTQYTVLNGISPAVGIIFQNSAVNRDPGNNKSALAGSMLVVNADLFLPSMYAATQSVYGANGLSDLAGTQTLHMFAVDLRYGYLLRTSNEFLKIQLSWGFEFHHLKINYDYPGFDGSYMEFTDETIDKVTMESFSNDAGLLFAAGANYELERFRVFAGTELHLSPYSSAERHRPLFAMWTLGAYIPFIKPE